ncbi:MAG TPA: hypothetical protein VM223_27590 [Planctomycetota bacterium]|nr:hypothetical protein [Planctomycetota bacterium]
MLGGVAVDRWGAKAVLRVPLVGCAASLGLAACPGPWPLLLVALLVMHGTCDTAAYMWMSSVLGNELCYDRRVFLPGAVMAAFSLAYVASRSILSVLPERWGTNAMMIALGLLGGGLFLAGVLSRDQAMTSIGYVAGAFCWSVEYPTFLSTLANTTKRLGTALAAQAVAGGLALFVMVYLMGRIDDALGDAALWKILLIPACGFPLVGLGGAGVAVQACRTASCPADRLTMDQAYPESPQLDN